MDEIRKRTRRRRSRKRNTILKHSCARWWTDDLENNRITEGEGMKENEKRKKKLCVNQMYFGSRKECVYIQCNVIPFHPKLQLKNKKKQS